MIGTNRDEMSAFVGFEYDAVGNPLTADRYEELIGEAFGDDGDAVLAEYPASAFPSPALASGAGRLGRDGRRVPGAAHRAGRLPRHGPVFAYEFQEDSGLVYEGYPLGAFHGWELKYLFDLSMPNGYPDLTADQQRLARDLRARWAAFAHDGSPNGWGRTWWPSFRPGAQAVVGISTDSFAPTPLAADHHCDFWASL